MHNFCVWIKGSGINTDYFAMNVFISSGDNHSFMAIMAFPNKGLSLFDFEKPLKAQNTTAWNTPHRTTKSTFTADAFKKVPHYINLVAIKQKGCQSSYLLYQKEIGLYSSFRIKYQQALEVGYN